MKASWKKKLLALLLACVMVVGMAVAASAGGEGPDGEPPQEVSKTQGTGEAADTAETSEIAAEPAAAPMNLLDSLVTKAELLALAPAFSAPKTTLVTGEELNVAINVTPMDGVTYTDVEFLVQATGIEIATFSNSLYPNLESYALGDGQYLFRVKTLTRTGSGDITSAVSFKVYFPTGTTVPGEGVGQIDIVSVSCGGASVSRSELDAVRDSGLTAVFNAQAGVAWAYSQPAQPEPVALAPSAASDAAGAVAVPVDAGMLSVQAYPNPVSGARGYLNTQQLSAQFKLEYAAGFELPLAAAASLHGQVLDIPAGESGQLDLLRLVNSNSYPVTVTVKEAETSYILLEATATAPGGDLHGLSLQIGHNKVYYTGLAATATLQQVDFVTLSQPDGASFATLLGGGTSVLAGSYTQTQAIGKDGFYDAAALANEYVSGISKRLVAYHYDLDGTAASYGIVTDDTAQTLSRVYITNATHTNATHPNDSNADTIWFEIEGIENAVEDIDIEKVTVTDSAAAAEMYPSGFRVAAFGNGDVKQRVYLVSAGIDTLLYEDGTAQGGADPKVVGTETVYLIPGAQPGDSLRFEFDNIGMKEEAQLTSNPFVLVKANPSASSSVTEAIATFTNTLVSEATYNTSSTATETATASVGYHKGFPEDVSVEKTMVNKTAVAESRPGQLAKAGDELEFTVSFTLPKGTDFVNNVVIVDEFKQNLEMLPGMTARVEITRENGSEIEIDGSYHAGYTGSGNTVYTNVAPVTKTQDSVYNENQMAYYFDGLLVNGDSITITYSAKVSNPIDTTEGSSIKNVVYVATGTNGAWNQTGGGGSVPPVWVPGTGDGGHAGDYNGTVVEDALYAAVDLWMVSERGNIVSMLAAEKGTLVVQGGLPYAQQDSVGPTFIIQTSSGGSGYARWLNEVRAFKYTSLDGVLDEESRTELQDFEVKYYNFSGIEITGNVMSARYVSVDFPGLAFNRDEVIRLEIGITGGFKATNTNQINHTLTAYMATGLNSSSTRYTDEPYAMTAAQWGADTTVVTASSYVKTILGWDPNASTDPIYCASNKIPFAAMAGYPAIYLRKSFSSNPMSNAPITFTVQAHAGGEALADAPLEVTHVVDILPLGLELASIQYVGHGTNSPVGYTYTQQQLEDGRWQVVITLDKTEEVKTGATNSEYFRVVYSAVVSDGVVVPSEGIRVTNYASIYHKGETSQFTKAISNSTETFVSVDDESPEDYALWWQIPGMDSKGYRSRIVDDAELTIRPPRVEPGIAIEVEGPDSLQNISGGVNVEWKYTVSNIVDQSNIDQSVVSMTNYVVAIVLPTGYTYDVNNQAGMTANKATVNILENHLGQQVLIWSGNQTKGTSSSYTFRTHSDEYLLGTATARAILLPEQQFVRNYAGTMLTADELENGRWLDGTDLSGAAVMAEQGFTLTNSIYVTSELTVENIDTGVTGSTVTAGRNNILTYNMVMDNLSTNTYSNLALFNVLPAPNDRTVLLGFDRGSEWSPDMLGNFSAELNGTGLGSNDFTVYYSATVPASKDEWNGSAGWVTASSWALNQPPAAFKVEFDPQNVELRPLDGELVFVWDIKVPEVLGIQDRNKWAVNSMAFRLYDGGTPHYNEPTPVNVIFETEGGMELEVTKTYNYVGASDATPQTFLFQLYVKRGDSWREVNLATGGYDIDEYADGEILPDGTLAITVAPNDTETVTISGLQEDAYRIEEISVDPEFYTVDMPDGGELEVLPQWWAQLYEPAHTGNSITITNTRIPRISLELKKTIVDASGFPRDDSFTLELRAKENGEWEPFSLAGWRVNTSAGVSVDASGRLVVSPQGATGDFTATVANLPAGEYQLVELGTDVSDYWIVDTTGATSNSFPLYTTTVLSITNTRKAPAELTLVKELRDTTGSPANGSFSFQLQRLVNGLWVPVELQPAHIATDANYTVLDGKLVLATTAGGSYVVTVKGLENGTYRFAELYQDPEHELISWDTEGLTLAQEQTGSLTIINQRIQSNAAITLEKTVADPYNEALPGEEFYFRLDRRENGADTQVMLNATEVEGAAVENGLLVFSFDGPGSKAATIKNLEPGTYVLTEVNVDTARYTVQNGYAQFNLATGQNASWRVTNTRVRPTQLTVEKVLNSDVPGTYTMRVEQLVDELSDTWAAVDLSGYTVAGGNVVTSSGTGLLEVAVPANDRASATITGLPHGTYRVQEQGVDTDWFKVQYSVAGVSLTNGSMETITVTNTAVQPAQLTLTKKLVDESNTPAGGTFTFRLEREVGGTFTPVDLTGHVADMSLVNAGNLVLTFNAPGELTATLTGLLPGTYRLVELDGEAAGYDVHYSQQQLALAEGEAAGVTVTNTRILPQTLVVSKLLEDTTLHPVGGSFTFAVEAHNGGGWEPVELSRYTVAGVQGVTVSGETFTIALQPGESLNARIEGMPAGTYRVTEIGVDTAQYQVAYSDGQQGVSISASTSGKITVTNTRIQPTTLGVTKTLLDATAQPQSGTFTFVVERLRSDTGAWDTIKLYEYTLANSSGKISITLDGYLALSVEPGESVTAYVEGLPDGTYRVRELEAGDDYDVSVQPGQLALQSSEVKMVEVTNTRKEGSGIIDPPGPSDPSDGSSEDSSTIDPSSGPSDESSSDPSSGPSEPSSSPSSGLSSSSSDRTGGTSSSPDEGGAGSSSTTGGSNSGGTPDGGGGTNSTNTSSSSRPRPSSSSSPASSSSASESSSSALDSSSSPESGSLSIPSDGTTEEEPPGTPGGETPDASTSRRPVIVDENGGHGDPGDPDYIQPNGSVRLFGVSVPWGGVLSLGGWSLVNLILSLIALFSGVVVLAQTLAVRNRRHRDVADEDLEEDERPHRRRSISRKLFAAASGLLPLAFFLIVERFTIVIMFTKWTPFVFALFLLHFLLLALSGYRRKQQEEDEEPEGQEA